MTKKNIKKDACWIRKEDRKQRNKKTLKKVTFFFISSFPFMVKNLFFDTKELIKKKVKFFNVKKSKKVEPFNIVERVTKY